MKAVRIAMCQIVCMDGDRRGNLARIEHAVAEAARAGAEIACLPESAIYGWMNPEAHRRAHPIPGEDSRRLCEIAKRHKMFLCVGLDEKAGEDLYDSALLIDDAGRILLSIARSFCSSELMTPPYSAGADVQVVETRFGRIGVLICADTHEPEILATMAELKPDLVLVPYGYAAPEQAWPKHGKAARTRRHECGQGVRCPGDRHEPDRPDHARPLGGPNLRRAQRRRGQNGQYPGHRAGLRQGYRDGHGLAVTNEPSPRPSALRLPHGDEEFGGASRQTSSTSRQGKTDRCWPHSRAVRVMISPASAHLRRPFAPCRPTDRGPPASGAGPSDSADLLADRAISLLEQIEERLRLAGSRDRRWSDGYPRRAPGSC